MNLELEKKKLDLRKLETGKYEQEYKILEKLADIDRIKENIIKQDIAIEKTKNDIAELQE